MVFNGEDDWILTGHKGKLIDSFNAFLHYVCGVSIVKVKVHVSTVRPLIKLGTPAFVHLYIVHVPVCTYMYMYVIVLLHVNVHVYIHVHLLHVHVYHYPNTQSPCHAAC